MVDGKMMENLFMTYSCRMVIGMARKMTAMSRFFSTPMAILWSVTTASLLSLMQRSAAMVDHEFVMQTIRNLMSVVCALEPNPERREAHMIDEVLKDADTAIQILTKGE
jgi:hypothetical protein